MTTAFSVRLTRDVITARGADARSFLHSQLSNDIMSLAPESSRYSFVLEPTGKLSAFLRVWCVAEDHFTIDVDEGCGAAALARLNKFKIRVKCDFGLATQNVLALRGLDAAARVAALAQPGAVTAWRDADGAVDIFDAANGLASTDDTTAPTADLATYHTERLRCAWPIFGIDFDGDTIPAETSLVDVCVSFTKGCYPGQELVERMDSRGSTAPRRLLRLPAHPANGRNATLGESYVVGGVSFGRCTSVAGDFALVMVTRAHLGEAEALVSP
ncbi:MAG: YgfZ/GcvT domain-containing protein [Actinomycetota bacterium]